MATGRSSRGGRHNRRRGRSPTPRTLTRFRSKVDDGDVAGCWLWTGTRHNAGYGVLAVDLGDGRGWRNMLAHRVAWWVDHGRPPDADLRVCHHCDVRLCVRPDDELRVRSELAPAGFR